MCFALYGQETAAGTPGAEQNLYVALVLVVVVLLTCSLAYYQEGQTAKATDAFKVRSKKLTRLALC
jgi:hypothetical protein